MSLAVTSIDSGEWQKESKERYLFDFARICPMFLIEKIVSEGYYRLNVQLELYYRDGLPKHVDDRSPQYPDKLGSDG